MHLHSRDTMRGSAPRTTSMVGRSVRLYTRAYMRRYVYKDTNKNGMLCCCVRTKGASY